MARLNDAATEAVRLGVEAIPVSVDLVNADAVETAADSVENELGPIDMDQ